MKLIVTYISVILFNVTNVCQWSETSPLLTARAFHSAVKLNNGNVLVTGGGTLDSAFSSCEIFNSQTHIWLPAASMNFSHKNHKSFLLPDGKVFVCGGNTTICELYDPALDNWVVTESTLFTTNPLTEKAIIDENNNIFLIGTVQVGQTLYSTMAQIYNYQNGYWVLIDTLNKVKFNLAVSPFNHSILATGGYKIKNCELYNFSYNFWEEIAQTNETRGSHTQTELLNGNVLITGGDAFTGSHPAAKETCELLNINTMQWSYITSMNYSRYSHQAVLLNDGKVLVIGGAGGLSQERTATEIYSPLLDTWTLCGDITHRRWYFTTTKLDSGHVLITGGLNPAHNSTIPSCEMFVYDPTTVEYNWESNLNSFSLSQNYPNPFNPSTKISWQAPVSGWQTLKVYDVLGNEVATLVDEYRNVGSYEVEFKSTVGSRQLANGVYFCQLKAGDYLETKKMILLK